MKEKYENELVEKCKENNRNAQHALYELHADLLYAICARYCGNSHDAQDCFQDSFEKIFTKINQFKEGNIVSWMTTITINTCIQFLKDKKQLQHWDDYLVPDNGKQEEKEFDDEMNNIETSQLFNAIKSLSPKYRAVFNLYYIEEKSQREISGILAISEGTSKSNLYKAKKKLQQILMKKYPQYGK